MTPKIWSQSLLKRFFDDAAFMALAKYWAYADKGEPVIQHLPEDYSHDHAQSTRAFWWPESFATPLRYAVISETNNILEYDGLRNVDYTIIPELPRWYGDAAARESATGERAAAARDGDPAKHADTGADDSAHYDSVGYAVAYGFGVSRTFFDP